MNDEASTHYNSIIDQMTLGKYREFNTFIMKLLGNPIEVASETSEVSEAFS